MNKLLTLALAASLCTPLLAQKMGSTNTNAPSVKQTVMAGEHEISLDYISITWASGKTMTTLMDKEKGGRARDRVNNMAKDAPLGTFSCSSAVKCGDLMLPAGEYNVFFTISPELEWHINFMADEKVHTHKLQLSEGHEESKRLMLCMYAADNDGAGVYVAFGKKMGFLTFTPQVEKKG